MNEMFALIERPAFNNTLKCVPAKNTSSIGRADAHPLAKR